MNRWLKLGQRSVAWILMSLTDATPITVITVQCNSKNDNDDKQHPCLCAAERTATSSRLASTLLDCMTQGSSNTGSQQQPSTSSQRPAAETALSCNGGAGPVIIIACVESADDVPASFRRCFTHEIQLEAPDAAARRRLLQVC